jgi:hypothetical protein
MKKLLLILTSCLFSLSLLSQSCLPEGITFTTQSQIDSFQIVHPNCTEIEGDVYINGDDIYNLNGLNVIVSIGGNLLIESNDILTDLTGLENLESISGSLLIGNFYFDSYPYATGNPSLTNLTGLNSLTVVEGNFEIYDNNDLETLSGLESLVSVHGNLTIGSIDYFYGFKFGNESLPDLSGLNNLVEVGGVFSIAGNDNLVNFEGLNNLVSIGGNFWTAWNDTLEDFSGLEQLASVGGSVDIRGNNSLISLNGLENLASLQDGLKIGGNYDGNPQLSDLTALIYLTSIGGNLEIIDNDVLANLSGLNNIEAGSIEDLTIVNNNSLTTCDIYSICQYLANPNGTIAIHDNADGCDSVEELEELCGVSIHENTFFKNIKIHPNPISTTAAIEYELKQPVKVMLSIYNHVGQPVYQTQETQSQGSQQLIWNAERLPAGVYFCVIKTNQGIQTTKLIKL